MGADYSFELNSIETYAPPFFGHNNIFLGSVIPVRPSEIKPSLIRTYQKTVETLIKVALVDIITEWE